MREMVELERAEVVVVGGGIYFFGGEVSGFGGVEGNVIG